MLTRWGVQQPAQRGIDGGPVNREAWGVRRKAWDVGRGAWGVRREDTAQQSVKPKKGAGGDGKVPEQSQLVVVLIIVIL